VSLINIQAGTWGANYTIEWKYDAIDFPSAIPNFDTDLDSYLTTTVGSVQAYTLDRLEFDVELTYTLSINVTNQWDSWTRKLFTVRRTLEYEPRIPDCTNAGCVQSTSDVD